MKLELKASMGQIDHDPKKPSIKNRLTIERIKAQNKFAQKYDLQTIINESWADFAKTQENAPQFIYDKVIFELYDEYGEMTGDPEIIKKYLKEDAVKQFKKFH